MLNRFSIELLRLSKFSRCGKTETNGAQKIVLKKHQNKHQHYHLENWNENTKPKQQHQHEKFNHKRTLTSSLASSLSLSRGRLSCCWCWTNACRMIKIIMMKMLITTVLMMTWMSTLKPSLDGHSADCVASSHFSKSKARRGKRGCLYICLLSASNWAWVEGGHYDK